MNCSRLAAVLLAAVAFAAVAGVAPAHAGSRSKPDFQIKFATLAPDGSTWMKTMRAIDAELRERTEGRVGFKFYTGGVQGDEKDVLRKIRNGQLHSGGFTGFGLGTVVPEVRVQELPFLFRDLAELDYLREQTDDLFMKLFDDAGYINLGWTDVGFVYLMSKQPIRTPEDMDKARMWVWSGDPLAELFFRAFDLSPIPLAAPDVLTSLQTGIIDAVYGSPLAAVALQWFTRIDYLTDVPITHGIGAVLVSKRALRKVSPEDVEILRQVAAPHLRALTLKTREQNVEAIEEMKKEGVEVVSVDPADRDQFYATGRGAWKDGVGELYPQSLLDRVVSVVEEYRASQPDSTGR
jgi:TRAP-type C4-dicarboxylate transport system substrate-binding protein